MSDILVLHPVHGVSSRARATGTRHRRHGRAVQLFAGLVLFGISIALLVRARLGLDPWDVLHQGIARQTGLQLGWIVDIVAALVLLAWIPLRQRPGVGTLANVVLVGVASNVTLAVVADPAGLTLRALFLVAGVVANGFATGLYIGADLGPGPRDGLMIGLARRGLSIRVARIAIELTVLLAGFLLGGTVGVGTLVYACAIGPLCGFFIPRLSHQHWALRAHGVVADPLSAPSVQTQGCSTADEHAG
jgi:uncharacterized membrane protein YczE